MKTIQHQLAKLLLLAVTLTSIQLSAQTIVDIPVQRDNTLYERAAGDLSNGAGDHLFFGLTGVNAGNVLRRAVLAFDLSIIPPGNTITDASLSITVNMVAPGATAFNAGLHRLQADWGEGTSNAPGPEGGGIAPTANDATWIHTFFDTQFWSTPGGDFDAQASATAMLDSNIGEFSFSSPELIADIQDMIDNPGENFGWIILGEEGNDMNARRISSRENTSPGAQPLLTVTFEEGAAPIPVAVPVPTISSSSLLLLVMLMLVATLTVVRFRS